MYHNPERPHRRSNRLRGFDYTQAGAYFVTIVAQERTSFFGLVCSEEMRPNEAGRMACRIWESLPLRFPAIEMDSFVVMPNHLHGIVLIHQEPVGAPLVGARRSATGESRATTRVAPTLGDVIGAYKSLTTVEYVRGVRTMNWPPFHKRLWQRNYYERVVRDEESLESIRQYILDNPARWSLDPENPNKA